MLGTRPDPDDKVNLLVNGLVTLAPRNLREVWPNLSMDRRRSIVKAVLVKITVIPQAGGSRAFHPDKIHAEWRA
jgi:hypothetical protein